MKWGDIRNKGDIQVGGPLPEVILMTVWAKKVTAGTDKRKM